VGDFSTEVRSSFIFHCASEKINDLQTPAENCRPVVRPPEIHDIIQLIVRADNGRAKQAAEKLGNGLVL
jgi:hypothetical protein